MPLSLRRIKWDDAPGRQDFSVIENGRPIGRVYLTLVPDGERWQWCVYGLATRSHPPAGLADTLDDAKAAFQSAWSRCEPR
jgi:hypothetical protein